MDQHQLYGPEATAVPFCRTKPAPGEDPEIILGASDEYCRHCLHVLGADQYCVGAIQPREWQRSRHPTFHRLDCINCQDNGDARLDTVYLLAQISKQITPCRTGPSWLFQRNSHILQHCYACGLSCIPKEIESSHIEAEVLKPTPCHRGHLSVIRRQHIFSLDVSETRILCKL